jgi:protein Mpv17
VVLRNKNAEILARVAIDQTVFAPVFIGVFLSSMAILEGGRPKDKLAQSYVPALTANYMIWPWVQLANFKFVPPDHRLLFVNTIAIGWNCYLSYLNGAGSSKAPKSDKTAAVEKEGARKAEAGGTERGPK